MRVSYLAYTFSLAMMYLSIVLFLPVIVALIYGEMSSILPFLYVSFGTLLGGFCLKKFVKGVNEVKSINDIKKSEALFTVTFCWIMAGVLGAIPYVLHGFNPINAFFESTAGITATGGTILTNYDYPHALMFWRSFSQWLGGMGIIVLFIAVLPQFAIAGRQLFFAEAPFPEEDKFTPRIKSTASSLWKLYFGLTVLEIILLCIAGEDVFVAICNSFSSVSGGGFSPNSNSLIGATNPILWIVCFFMFCAGASYSLQYKAITRFNPLVLFKNEEFRTYLSIALILAVLLSVSLFANSHYDILKSITHSFFQVSSVMSTTCLSSDNFASWDYTSKALLFVGILAGSCASSAGGGVKIMRWILLFKLMKSEFVKILHPKAVYNVKVNNYTVSKDILFQILMFVSFYILIMVVTGFVVSILEGNAVIGITGSISTIGNIGPTLCNLTGPLGSYDSLCDSSKLILSANMYIGRLELIPFLVLFQKEIWNFKA